MPGEPSESTPNGKTALYTLLIVEDDESIGELLTQTIKSETPYAVLLVTDAVQALKAVEAFKPSLFILDYHLPGIDGLEVCRQLRRERTTATTPILMLTAKAEEIDKVVGLEVGADDYVTKPFGRRELLARVRALLRRSEYPSSAADEGSNIQEATREMRPQGRDLVAGPLRIDPAGRRVICRGQELELQPKQYELLTYLVRNRGTVLTRDQLLHNVWGYDYVGDTRTVDVHIRWLREKIEEDPANPKLIQTVRGVGYVFRW